MSDRTRNLLALIMLVVLASSAFVAGYFTNDFVELQTGGTLVRQRDDFDVFWEAWDRIGESFIGDMPVPRDLAYGAIRGSMANLNDPYTIFIEPIVRQEERQSLQGHFGGIGATLSRPEEGGPIILDPIPGNPAEKAGMLTGDVLIAVDGVEITPEITVVEVRDMIRGETGTVVSLTVIHEGEEESVVLEIVRGDILDPSVSSRIVGDEDNIGYIRLARFSGESSGEVAEAINKLLDEGAESLILDLRNNGGGLLTAAVDVSDHFLDDGPILYQITKDEGEKEYLATEETLVPALPLVVLINGGTASASEIVAGAMQDRDRATLIGDHQSFGKGSVQLVYDLSDGSSVHVTSARWFTPNRNQIDQQGLQPDILVEVTQEAIENGRDEVLNRAIEFLQNGEQ
ncbi:MAG: S41 family peptidase [Anaerolineae bacterium]|nr:S41 family peptidase [Anaerolineae bacterium]